MSNVSLDLAPGYLLEERTVNWVLSDAVNYISFTQNGPQPAVSEYIAYDTLTPPNPFIAVTQDGRGNVVYDGGFPKFYNSAAPDASVTQFSQLSASFKFLWNALNFIANPVKVAAGNRKILLLGDKPDGTYWVKEEVISSGFATSFNRLAAIANWQLTIKDSADYGGMLNPTLAELEQYAAVIVMSSQSAAIQGITTGAINEFITYRENGNGLLIITDHGPEYTDINDVVFDTPNTFFNTANRLAVNFGAFFTGTYNRTPVNVGYLRANYGDHPLYAGLSDSEDIFAGGSESKVVVGDFAKYTKLTAPSITLTEGRQTIQAIAVLNDGATETYRFVYQVATGEIVQMLNETGQPITINEIGLSNVVPFNVTINGQDLGTLTGDILHNGTIIGNFSYTEAGGLGVTWLNGNTADIRVNDQDTIEVSVRSPFAYRATQTVHRFQPDVGSKLAPARLVSALHAYNPELPPRKVVRTVLRDAQLARTQSTARNLKRLRAYLKR